MKKSLLLSACFILLTFAGNQTVYAQNRDFDLEIEVEPVAYILGGAGATVGYQPSAWTYSIEAFGGLTIPESMHGNNEFRAHLSGVEFQAERFLSGQSGFYVGPEFGVSRLSVTHISSDKQAARMNYSIGFRGGYQWNTGLGNLYLNPLAGFSYALNAENITIDHATFESRAFTPFATIGVGWSF